MNFSFPNVILIFEYFEIFLLKSIQLCTSFSQHGNGSFTKIGYTFGCYSLSLHHDRMQLSTEFVSGTLPQTRPLASHRGAGVATA